MMDRADIERERVSLLPVRELITVTDVRPIRLSGHEEIFIIKGHLDETPMAMRSLRTTDGLKASVCRAAIGRPSIYITWQRNPFNRMAWNEHDLITVEPQ